MATNDITLKVVRQRETAHFWWQNKNWLSQFYFKWFFELFFHHSSNALELFRTFRLFFCFIRPFLFDAPEFAHNKLLLLHKPIFPFPRRFSLHFSSFFTRKSYFCDIFILYFRLCSFFYTCSFVSAYLCIPLLPLHHNIHSPHRDATGIRMHRFSALCNILFFVESFFRRSFALSHSLLFLVLFYFDARDNK